MPLTFNNILASGIIQHEDHEWRIWSWRHIICWVDLLLLLSIPQIKTRGRKIYWNAYLSSDDRASDTFDRSFQSYAWHICRIQHLRSGVCEVCLLLISMHNFLAICSNMWLEIYHEHYGYWGGSKWWHWNGGFVSIQRHDKYCKWRTSNVRWSARSVLPDAIKSHLHSKWSSRSWEGWQISRIFNDIAHLSMYPIFHSSVIDYVEDCTFRWSYPIDNNLKWKLSRLVPLAMNLIHPEEDCMI